MIPVLFLPSAQKRRCQRLYEPAGGRHLRYCLQEKSNVALVVFSSVAFSFEVVKAILTEAP